MSTIRGFGSARGTVTRGKRMKRCEAKEPLPLSTPDPRQSSGCGSQYTECSHLFPPHLSLWDGSRQQRLLLPTIKVKLKSWWRPKATKQGPLLDGLQPKSTPPPCPSHLAELQIKRGSHRELSGTHLGTNPIPMDS